MDAISTREVPETVLSLTATARAAKLTASGNAENLIAPMTAIRRQWLLPLACG
jgi:hypothetical protein